MSPAFTSGFRLFLLAAAVAACFSGIGYRLYSLQVVEAGELALLAERARRQVIVQPARRGNIVDANGGVLATTRTLIELGIDPQSVTPADKEKFSELARLTGIPLEEIREAAARRTTRGPSGFADDVRLVRWVKLHDGIDEVSYGKVLDLGLRSVYGNRRYVRFYPGNELAAHLLGFLNREETPVGGIESHLDFYLRGQEGWVESERDGRRRELVQFRNREVRPTDGLHAALTIDHFIQHVVEEELGRIAETFTPQGATVIVSDPVTGAVLAMGNYPTFDLNRFHLEPIAHQRNLAITDVLEPGSTFKIVPAAGALNERLVTPSTVFNCGISSIEVGNRMVRLPRDHRPFGELTVEGIMVKSSNIGVAHLGVMLGSRRLHDYASRFGFGEPTGFPLGGEVRGTLHPVRNWDGLTITRLPMGHAVSATPLQIHQATGAVANGGVLMRPMLVNRVFNDAGETVVSFAPEARRRVISGETARTISGMLRKAAAPGGTAAQAEIRGYEVAGKTGTTQKIVNGRYSNRHHVASFSGFFPASNPRVVMTIIIDEPQTTGSAYGGLVAAPSFKRVAEQLIPYLGIRPSDGSENYFALERDIHDHLRQTGF